MTFTWLGMVLAISFLEAPLRFRAPGVDPQIGLGIGRLVFRALNTVEAALAGALIVVTIIGAPSIRAMTATVVAATILGAQLSLIRPRLTRRSDRILAGEDAPRSGSHHAYVVLEIVKVTALLTTGVLLLVT
ncbi:hypothetical protein [Nonomuraea sediminis]|uniref:hypothetical protein n=1 Tax=Nonomuraea sediminis TaxID=2835864 RepID=UPI00202A13F1|nr:hypothetical protein [Nonomuraea sediminis]